MRDTLGALLVLGAGEGGATGGSVVVGMSGDYETLRAFCFFQGVRE